MNGYSLGYKMAVRDMFLESSAALSHNQLNDTQRKTTTINPAPIKADNILER